MLPLLLACNSEPNETGEDPAPLDSDAYTDHDADADGHDAPEWGGDDCDDNSASVYPGAQELCDDLDQDCDGEPLAPGVCGEVQPLDGLVSKLVDYGAIYTVPIRDVTGDGLDDLLLDDTSGSVGIVPGGGSVEGFADAELSVVWGGYDPCYLSSMPLDVGDVDGDGFNDVVLYAKSCLGSFEIAWGPVAEGSPLTNWLAYPEDVGHVGAVRVGDLNGDSRPDITTFQGLRWESTLVTYMGGSREVDARRVLLDDYYCYTCTADNLGDVDGDGMDDLLLSTPYQSPWEWISGVDVASSDDASLSDIAAAQIDFGDERTRGISDVVPSWLRVHDQTGDGLDDSVLVESGTGHEQYFGAIHYFDGFTTGDAVVETARIVNDVPEYATTSFANWPATLWADGEPAAILVSSNLTSGESETFALGLDWPSGTSLLSDTDILSLGAWLPNGEGTITFTGWGQGDLDGDGWTDVTVVAANSTWLLNPLKGVPWGDAPYW